MKGTISSQEYIGRRTSLLVLWLALLLPLWLALPAWASETLAILHTNDTHSHLVPFDTSGEGKDIGGIARRAVLFKQARAQQPNTLMVDAGDVFQGTPVYTFFKGEADMKAMDMAGYDIGTLGNHDLDNGPDNLKKQLQHIHYPFLCANVLGPDNKPIFQGWSIVTRGGLKVAVIGLMGRQAWDVVTDRNKAGMRLVDPKKVLQELVPELRKRANLVVAVTHQGWQEDLDMVKDLAGIDAVIGGHSHTRPRDDQAVLVKNGSDNGIGGTIVVQAFQWGIFVGRLDLTVDGNKISEYRWQLVPIDAKYNPPGDDPLARLVSEYEDQIAAKMNEVIGEATTLMTNQGSRQGEIALGDLVADILREKTQADIAVINAGGLREELPAGPITVGRVFSILPFDNLVVTLKMKGSDVLALVQRIARQVGKSGFMQVSGLSFTVKDGQARDIKVGPRLGPPPASSPTPVPTPLVQRTVLVTRDLVNVRRQPALTAPLVGLLRRGARWPVLGLDKRQEWAEVQMAGGKRGWVSVPYVQITTTRIQPRPVKKAPPSPYEPLNPDKTYTMATIDYLVYLKSSAEGNLFARGTEVRESGLYVRDVVTDYIRRQRRIEPPPLNRMRLAR